MGDLARHRIYQWANCFILCIAGSERRQILIDSCILQDSKGSEASCCIVMVQHATGSRKLTSISKVPLPDVLGFSSAPSPSSCADVGLAMLWVALLSRGSWSSPWYLLCEKSNNEILAWNSSLCSHFAVLSQWKGWAFNIPLPLQYSQWVRMLLGFGEAGFQHLLRQPETLQISLQHKAFLAVESWGAPYTCLCVLHPALHYCV